MNTSEVLACGCPYDQSPTIWDYLGVHVKAPDVWNLQLYELTVGLDYGFVTVSMSF